MAPTDPSIGAEMARKRAARLQTCPATYRGQLARCYDKRISARMAVRAFCMECVGYERQAVTECAAYACPIWEYRPFQP